ncbi:MAG: AI-2E family transporter [Actinomycetota bacterium]
MSDEHEVIVARRDDQLRVWGIRSWYLVGMLLLAALVIAGLSAISGFVAPMVISVVLAMLFAPATDWLAKFMPTVVAAGVVLVGLMLVVVLVLTLVVLGIADQATEIGDELTAGLDDIGEWLDDLGWSIGDSGSFVTDLGAIWDDSAEGLSSFIGTAFSSAAAFVAGSFVAAFLLYLLLADWHRVVRWVGSHLGVRPEVGADIVQDATWSMQQYFLALTVSNAIVATIVGLTVLVLGVPLAFTIAVVTFLTAYVPYLGAIFSGAFAVLVALGSEGLVDAIIILAVVLFAQNVVETILRTKLSEGRLQIHPILVFGSTVLGAAVAGLLGAALSTPLTALAIRVYGRLNGTLDTESAALSGSSLADAAEVDGVDDG